MTICYSLVNFDIDNHSNKSFGLERFVVKSKLTQGTHSFGSTRGISSHEHCPFAGKLILPNINESVMLGYLAISVGHPSETTGEVHAFSIVYSGNYLFELEQEEMGRLRIIIGIHPMDMQWELQQGEVVNTCCYVVRRFTF
jgi:alpha-galactosidase